MSIRKLPLWQQAVSYEGVAITKESDFRSRIPAGYRPIMRRVRVGHGTERWEHATTTVMTWGVQRYAGYEIVQADTPAAVTDQTYVPVCLDEKGEPAPSAVSGEMRFGPDGMAFIVPGDSVVLKIPIGPFRLRAPARVIYVIDEPRRRGFAYGTLAGHPEQGEEAFIVEQTEDGSVWFELRAFSRPANLFWRLGTPVGRIVEAYFTRRYLESLSGPIT